MRTGPIKGRHLADDRAKTSHLRFPVHILPELLQTAVSGFFVRRNTCGLTYTALFLQVQVMALASRWP